MRTRYEVVRAGYDQPANTSSGPIFSGIVTIYKYILQYDANLSDRPAGPIRCMATRTPMTVPPAAKWYSTGATHAGKVRSANEDAYLDLGEHGLWVVADGMGGHDGGRIASRMLVDSVASRWHPVSSLPEAVDQIEDYIEEANLKLIDLAIRRQSRTIGSTVCALLTDGRHVVCLWAGDSRIYRLRNGKLTRLTQDHAVVEELVEAGTLTRAESERHPEANRITRAVGASPEIFLDIEMYDAGPGDRYLLCSDGLTHELPERSIARMLGASGEDPAEALVLEAVRAGGRDNITAVTVTFTGDSGVPAG